MNQIVLLGTVVYLNVLDVPGWNQDRDAVLEEFALSMEAGDQFLLPLATIWETGNHIADLPSGHVRRVWARKLVDDVNRALLGEVPYRPTFFPEREEFISWLQAFPDYAQRSKTEKKSREGIGLTDTTLIKEWERTCALHSMSTVRIWSLDADLKGYIRTAHRR